MDNDRRFWRRLLAGFAAAGILASRSAGAADWPQPGHDAAHRGDSRTESTISTANVASLALKWDVGTGSEISFPPLAAGNRIYAVNGAGDVIALRASDGKRLWSFAGNSTLTGGGIAVDPTKGLVFALCTIDSTHSGLCALNAKTGALVWNWAIYTDGGNPVGSSPYNPPAVSDGMVFIGEADTVNFSHVGYLVALNEDDGSVVWQRGNCGDTGHNYCNFMGNNPAAVANGLVIYDTGYEQSPYAAVCAVGESDGALAWCFPAVAINQIHHAPSAANNSVFLSEADSGGNTIDFFSLDAKTGATLWNYAVTNGNGGGQYYPAAVAHGVVTFAAGGSPTIFAFDEKRGGVPIWQTSRLGDSGISLANGLVYGFNDDGLFALDATNGNPLWSYATQVRNATPFVVNGTLYATCNISDVCAFALP